MEKSLKDRLPESLLKIGLVIVMFAVVCFPITFFVEIFVQKKTFFEIYMIIFSIAMVFLSIRAYFEDTIDKFLYED